ncbi:MAG: nuclear transport factor 2 family protein [Bacteroidia bacterium]|nr:nuclear transport factor 2 family protein [Bacteroidia bacterium]NNF30025.1 nuclear transport factor 2 family protein [Flavobacteriaceae bacterium]MBT8274732.1 nuclear transport factor 2 family protein [Bacteroidia bacterium]NNJ82364.1 nuclear transport factor 2 family protein [Flavobacteriaceae bacterium]NNK53730.1 nuclear transport factor 2 family protein [Flavobacteriaceae bacterium]
MSNNAKEIVRSFYKSDILNDDTVLERYMHKDLVLIWNSADGLSIMNYDDLVEFFAEVRRSYNDLRIEVSHLLQDDNHITIRYKYYIRTMENPDEELGIAHFIAIWEVKDDKLYRGYQVSQPVTDKDDTTESYHRVKV